jgi:hypothetical protein
MKGKQWLGVLCVLGVLVAFGTAAHAKWHFGIGTGLFRLHMEGDQGFHTNTAGPVEFEVDLDPDDVGDLAKSAFGLGGYATDGQWMIQYSLGVLELEDDAKTTLPGGESVSSKINFETKGGEVTLGFPVFANNHVTFGVHGGVRYTEHELENKVTIVDGGTTKLSRDINESWTDAVIGLSADVPLAQKWAWNNRVNAGFGGSEGTYMAYTGVSWRFFPRWSATLYGKYMAVEYENGKKGDSDWYFYDVDEYGAGMSILFNW